MSRLTRSAAFAVAVGSGLVAYGSLIERNAFTLRRFTVPVLPADAPDLRILQISDIHMMPDQKRKQRWLASLATLQPDLVINTGDNLAHPASVLPVISALDPLLETPGAFVLGSNDYFSPVMKNPFSYLTGPSDGHGERLPDLPWRDLVAGFAARGWLDLSNRADAMTLRGVKVSLVGVDDPHIERDDLASAGGPDPSADVAVGVTHAPYRRVLDAWTTDGQQLILAGHTHGGQITVPGYGALITNCDLDTSRAKGLHRHEVSDHKSSWLHVSAGCGTSPYAPVRFACRPEATLLTLTALDSSGA